MLERKLGTCNLSYRNFLVLNANCISVKLGVWSIEPDILENLCIFILTWSLFRWAYFLCYKQISMVWHTYFPHKCVWDPLSVVISSSSFFFLCLALVNCLHNVKIPEMLLCSGLLLSGCLIQLPQKI